GCGYVAPERIVIQHEQGCDRERTALSPPPCVRGPRRGGPQRVYYLLQMTRTLLATQFDSFVRRRPELVVARGPHDRRESLIEQTERPFEVGDRLADVAAHDQPIGGVFRPHMLDDLAILRVR